MAGRGRCRRLRRGRGGRGGRGRGGRLKSGLVFFLRLKQRETDRQTDRHIERGEREES